MVREPLEILKTTGEQVVARPSLQPSPKEKPQEAKPSLEEKRAPRTLLALETEIEDIRKQKKQAAVVREQEKERIEEERKQAMEKQKKESFFQKFLKRIQRRVEGPKLPQAT